jgi:hypothetical protein
MKETLCRYKKHKIEMVQNGTSGTVDWCELLKLNPSLLMCKYCEWGEPPPLETIKNLIKSISKCGRR